MSRVATVAALALLIAPATASAKGGVTFDGAYPDLQDVGSPMSFTAMVMRGEGTREYPMRPIEGARPLITFRNTATGGAIRVRGSRSNHNGISHGTARLPAHGPWEATVTVAGRAIAVGDSQPFRVGVGLTQTTPAANAGAPAAPAAADANRGRGDPGGGGSLPWIWLTSIAAIGSALLAAAMRRRGRWGAA